MDPRRPETLLKSLKRPVLNNERVDNLQSVTKTSEIKQKYDKLTNEQMRTE
jgi:hypothetical protein